MKRGRTVRRPLWLARQTRHYPQGGVPLCIEWLAFLGVFCGACQKSDPAATGPGTPAGSVASATAAPAPSIPQAVRKSASNCAGKYTGTYAVAVTKADIKQKDGAPAQWEADDGKTLAGQGEISLSVGDDNVVSGAAKGALGEQTLRGLCDDSTLRVELDTASPDPKSVKNAVLLAELNGDQANGTLSAATGDSLVRRSGAVSLRRSE